MLEDRTALGSCRTHCARGGNRAYWLVLPCAPGGHDRARNIHQAHRAPLSGVDSRAHQRLRPLSQQGCGDSTSPCRLPPACRVVAEAGCPASEAEGLRRLIRISLCAREIPSTPTQREYGIDKLEKV